METIPATHFARQFGKRNQDVQTGIIQVTSHGRPIGYYISPGDYERLIASIQLGILRTFRATVLQKAPQIQKLANEHKVQRIRLFGSVARGEDTSRSDVDFLVTFRDDYDLMDDRLALAAKLEELLDRKVDLILESELNPKISPFILKDAIDL